LKGIGASRVQRKGKRPMPTRPAKPPTASMQHAPKEHAHEPIEALDRVFEAVDKRPRGKACEAMNGLLAECQEAIEEGESGPVLDAALIACLQGIKTYEVTRYGSLLAFARQMGLVDAVCERRSESA